MASTTGTMAYTPEALGTALFADSFVYSEADIILDASPASRTGAMLLANCAGVCSPQNLARYSIRLIVQCASELRGDIGKTMLNMALKLEQESIIPAGNYATDGGIDVPVYPKGWADGGFVPATTEISSTSSSGSSSGGAGASAARALPEPVAAPTLAQVLDLDMEDYEEFDCTAAIAKALPAMTAAIDRGNNVVVNCAAGRSRSTTIVIAYLMTARRMTLQDSLLLVRSRRPIACPNLGFMLQLMKMELGLFGSVSIPIAALKRHHAYYHCDLWAPQGQWAIQQHAPQQQAPTLDALASSTSSSSDAASAESAVASSSTSTGAAATSTADAVAEAYIRRAVWG